MPTDQIAQSVLAIGHQLTCYPNLATALQHDLKGMILLWPKCCFRDDQRILEHFTKKKQIRAIILITEALNKEEQRAYRVMGVKSAIAPDTDRAHLNQILELLSSSTVSRNIDLSHPSRTSTYKTPLGKRLFDIAASAGALVILSPLLLATAIAIRVESPGPIIYRAKRVGTNYHIFDFLKFRSMYTNADAKLRNLQQLNQYSAETPADDKNDAAGAVRSAHITDTMLISDDGIIPENQHLAQITSEQENAFVKLTNDPRVTKVGRFIRKYSIDELPQLINILRGDMSVVGNRPLPLYEAEQLTSDEYIERFMCPAGLTGLWQVEKRGSAGKLSAEERKQLDIEYAQHYSMRMDLKIIFKTFTAFIQKENV